MGCMLGELARPLHVTAAGDTLACGVCPSSSVNNARRKPQLGGRLTHHHQHC